MVGVPYSLQNGQLAYYDDWIYIQIKNMRVYTVFQ